MTSGGNLIFGAVLSSGVVVITLVIFHDVLNWLWPEDPFPEGKLDQTIDLHWREQFYAATMLFSVPLFIVLYAPFFGIEDSNIIQSIDSILFGSQFTISILALFSTLAGFAIVDHTYYYLDKYERVFKGVKILYVFVPLVANRVEQFIAVFATLNFGMLLFIIAQRNDRPIPFFLSAIGTIVFLGMAPIGVVSVVFRLF